MSAVGGDHADSRQGITEDYSEDHSEEVPPLSPPRGASPGKNKKNDFPGDLQAIKLDLDDLVEQAQDDFADPEALKSDADFVGYCFMSIRENVAASEQHAVFGAVSAAKAKIDATTSFPHQPTPRKSGSDEAVNDLPVDGSLMGEALLQAIDEAVDDNKRRGFEKLLLQWQRAKDKESPESPPDGSVTAECGPARPALRPADQNRVQGILDAVEIADF
jgi:hypothetical protein